MALNLLETGITEAREHIAKHEAGLLNDTALPPLCFSSQDILDWLCGAEAIGPLLAKEVALQMLSAAAEFSGIVHAATPQYGHYIAEDVYTIKLVRSKLLPWKGQAKLTELSLQLWKATSEATKFVAQYEKYMFGAGCGMVADDADGPAEILGKTSATFHAAHKAINVLCAVRALYSKSGSERASELAKLLDTKSGMFPQKLFAEMQKFRTPGASASSALVSAKAEPPAAKAGD